MGVRPTEEPEHSLLRSLNRIAFGLAAASLVLLAGIATVAQLRFKRLFEDFAVELPATTAWLIEIPFWAIALVLLIWGGALWLLTRRAELPGVSLLANAFSFLVAATFCFVAWNALYQPAMNLLEQL